MKIHIPSRVIFRGVQQDTWGYHETLCFRHAVLAAVAGVKVDCALNEEDSWGDDNCAECERDRSK